jgi:hypothetical protein
MAWVPVELNRRKAVPVEIRFRRFLSVDSAKAVKAQKYGFLNGINYGAPAKVAGEGNMCAKAGACADLCLAMYSGQAAMRAEGGTNSVVESRIAKTRYFMRERSAFMQEFAFHAAKLIRDARDSDMGAVIRPNGSWDQLFEGIGVSVPGALAERIAEYTGRPVAPGPYPNLMTLFPETRFVDYTKIAKRFRRALPANYDLTFSLAENNELEARDLLAAGVNVSAVFAHEFPETYLGRPVIDGDSHDLRFLDPKGGYIVGLTPKGRKAKADQSGFVIRNYETRNA